VFACCLDQVGLLELKPCISQTGGLCVLADTFGQSVFKESFRRVFRRFDDSVGGADAGQLQMGFGAVLEVLTSRDFKISGALGPCFRCALRFCISFPCSLCFRCASACICCLVPLTCIYYLTEALFTTLFAFSCSMKRISASVSDTETGESGTCAWSLGGVDPSTSLAVVFDVTAKDAGGVQAGKRHFLQLITYYQHSNGRFRMRVTTTGGAWCRRV
jgi:protein transport protein SEC23